MPYASIKDLPASIKKVLPTSGQKMFLEVFNSAYEKHGESTAMAMAWAMVKKHFKRKSGLWVAMSSDFEPPALYEFHLDFDSTKISNSIDEIVIEGILASTKPNIDGFFFEEAELHKIAEQINSNGSTRPDETHSLFKKLSFQYGKDYDAFYKAMWEEKGVLGKIKAKVQDGALWIQAVLDKTYSSMVEKYKSFSIEALADPEPNKHLTNPKYIGFTFANNPKVSGTDIVSVSRKI